MSDEWDPFKPVSWGKRKEDNNFFEPVNMYGTEKSSFWGFSTEESKSQSSFYSGSKEDTTWGWSVGNNEKKESSYWGYSNDDSKQGQSWSSSSGGDTLGFGSESAWFSLKARQEAFSKSSDWSSADIEWSYTNVNSMMDTNSAINKIEAKQGNWAFGISSQSSNWAWETSSNSNSSEYSSDVFWGFSSEPTKLKRW